MQTEQPAQLGIGARLAQARQAKGLSLGDIARQLKLTVKQVEALERDDHASFGSMVFVRGFLRGYAKFVQIDIADDLGRMEPAAPAQPRSAAAPTRPVPLRTSRAPVWTIAGAALLVGVVGVFVAAHQMGKDAPVGDPSSALSAKPSAPPAGQGSNTQGPGDAALAQAPATIEQAPTAASQAPADPQSIVQSPAVAVDGDATAAVPPAAPGVEATAGAAAIAAQANPAAPSASTSEPVVVTPSAQDGAVPAVAGPEVRLVFEADAWVEARDRSGMVVFSQMNKAGSEQVVKGEGPLSLVVGNARHVRVSYHGAPIDLGPHTRLDVARLTLK